MERDLLTCVDRARGAQGNAPEKLRAAMSDTSWKLLDNGERGLMMCLLLSDDKESKGHTIRRGMRRGPGGRNERRPERERWLLEVDLEDENLSAAMRWACLKIRHENGLNSPKHADEVLSSLRKECDKGVHPVWAKISELSPAVAEFIEMPVLDVSESTQDFDITGWYAASRIDPMDLTQLLWWLKKPIPYALSPDAQVNLRNLTQAIQTRKRGKNLDLNPFLHPSLFSIEGEGGLLGAILSISAKRDDAKELLLAVSGDGVETATDLLTLMQLRDGISDGFQESVSNKETDHLSTALRIAAWKCAPEEGYKVSLKELQAGESLLSEDDASARRRIRWWIVVALLRKGDILNAEKYLPEDADDLSKAIDTVRELAAKGSEVGGDWLRSKFWEMDAQSLLAVISEQRIAENLRVSATEAIIELDVENWSQSSSVLIDVLLSSVNIGVLSKLLERLGPEAGMLHPHAALISAHLHPAEPEGPSVEARSTARHTAIKSLRDANAKLVPDTVSSISNALLHHLDGGISDEKEGAGPTQFGLDLNGYKALKQCRRALAEGGDGLVADRRLDVLRQSVSNADFNTIERALFNTLISTLEISRAAVLLQRTQDPQSIIESESILQKILEEGDLKGRILGAITQLVVEHGLGIHQLMEWYRVNDPRHSAAAAVQAGYHDKQGDYRRAARLWVHAAKNQETDLENRVRFGRLALIGLARGKHWDDALNLLNDISSLRSMVTEDFQLYLSINHLMSKGNGDTARKKLIEHCSTETLEVRVNEEGEEQRTVRRDVSIEILEGLLDYPSRHRHLLPPEPFTGRIRATLRRQRERLVRTNRERAPARLRFRMAFEEGDHEAIGPLVESVARNDPSAALRMIEQCLSSDRFWESSKRQLISLGRSLFKLHEAKIPIRKRKHFHHLDLKPLVILDTNILVDALRDEIAQEVGLGPDIVLELGGRTAFRRRLLKQIESKSILGWIPPVVRDGEMEKWKHKDEALALFDNVLLSSDISDKISSIAEKTRDSVLKRWSTWPALGHEMNEEAVPLIEDLLCSHYDTFVQINRIKRKEVRTELRGDKIYPETGDLEVMMEAMSIAESSLSGIQSVAVATMDSDFIMIQRALEDRFGFAVISDAEGLQRLIGETKKA